MKLAIISDYDYIDKKGAFNAIHNRIKCLKNHYPVEIDVYLLLEYENWFIRKLRKTPKREKLQSIEYDGIAYHILWANFSLLRYLIRFRLHKYPSFLFKYKKHCEMFRDYDQILAHSTIAGILASQINERYSIPYSMSWHGSDIHTECRQNRDIEKIVSELILRAKNNFFVSQKLLEISPDINNGSKRTLYNGVDTNIFSKKPWDEIERIKKKNGIIYEKNIAYFGNLVDIKNSSILPLIFKKIASLISDVQFHIIGDGRLRSVVRKKCSEFNLNVVFYGNRPPHDMPELINCMDLIVLPSKNEGLPLVALESLACGVPMIGSDVGGISEAIGIENVVPLDADFIDNFSKLAVKRLTESFEVRWDDKFKLEVIVGEKYKALMQIEKCA